MKATRTRIHCQPIHIALLVAGIGLAAVTYSAETSIADDPLANPSPSAHPNIMFVLDDSGSMAWEYSPDYVSDNDLVEDDGRLDSESDPAICFDHKDDDGAITLTPTNGTAGTTGAKLKTCRLGDPPFMSPDFNKQYYNPEILYVPGVDYAGAELTNMNAANTANWTAVPTDPYGRQQRNQLQNQNNNTGSTTTVNLTTQYPDRIWCTHQAANWGDLDDASGTRTGTSNAPLCVKNSGYNYPSSVYGYGKNADTTAKLVYGTPYYYRIPVTEYCTTQDLNDCTSTSSSTNAFAATMRWCSNSGSTSGTTNSFSACQGKRLDSYIYPKAFGRVIGQAATPAASATASLTVTSVSDTGSGSSITNITVNGVPIIASTITCDLSNSSTNRNTCAGYIRSAINSHVSSPDYTATSSNNVVTITSVATGVGANGQAITVTSPSTGTTAATGTLTVSSVANPSSISNLTVNGVPIIASSVACNLSNSSTNRNTCAQNIVNAINSYTSNPDYTATRSSATITITAPVSLGSSANGFAIAETGSVVTTTTAFSGGVSTSPVGTTTTAFSGGADATTGVAPTRVGVSAFTRTNIVSGQSYPKYNKRTDCDATECTYAQEMTNFANWYAYYRTRMQMMKTAAGKTFANIDDGYRVGLKTINFSTSKYLKISDFTSGATGHKSAWFTKFYAQSPSGNTPLREALSRAGWIYAGKFGTGLTSGLTAAADDPMEISCQQNYTILSTDGYWNSSGGQDLSGNSMGNQDNSNADWTKRIDGAYDGQQPNTSCSSGSAPRSCGTLADVAAYYYKNDLRTGTGWADNVPEGYTGGTVQDKATHQHMTTFTIGLGLDGYLSYRPDYNSPTVNTGDFYAITQGSKNWPAVSADAPSALDDLWHTAVNGKGQFFSASNPQELISGLTSALDTITSVTGAGAAAATSNLQPVAGDNFAFTAEYTTNDWTGDLKARTIDLSNGNVSQVMLWSAKTLLDNKSWASRTIYTFDASDPLTSGSGNRNQLRHFCWPGASGICTEGSLTAGELTAYFNPTTLTHYGPLSASQQTAITKEKLVDYLRGDTSNEDDGSNTATVDDDLFRNRVSILGDIISSQPIYVKSTLFDYTDSSTSTTDQDEGYAKFRVCTEGSATLPSSYCNSTLFPHFPQSRRGTVFAAANDGMLHAFETDVNNDPYYQTAGISTTTVTTDDVFTGNNTGNGEERWAYIPGILLPSLKVLANKPYSHKYLLDGSPTVGDICIAPCDGADKWRTILVGGLNKGGRGYYALDITNPEAPKALWEFASSTTCLSDAQANAGTYSSDCHLGLSYGNPLITKRKSDGKWVVYVTSGYNNVKLGDATQGNGKGYLYMLDAYTGTILKRIGTGAGCDGVSTTAPCVAGTVDPSGLAKINGWVVNGAIDNTTLAIYGADLQGNLWKFDLDPANTSSYLHAIKLATLKDPSNVTQPVTTKPELAYIKGYRVVYLGTGKLLGTDDLVDDQVQTVYGIKDDMINATTVDARADTVAQSLDTLGGSTRTTTTNNTVNWDTDQGWHVDLPISRERVNVDPVLQLGTLTIASNIPGIDACQAGGYSYLNFFDITTGTGVETDTGVLSSVKFGNAMIVGLNVIKLPGGVIKVIVTTSDNKQITTDNPVPSASFIGKRVSWRELIKEQ